MRALGVASLVLGVALAAGLFVQFRTIKAMQAELVALRAERDATPKPPPIELAIAAATEARRKNDAEELGGIREELAALRVEVKQIAGAQTELKASVADALPWQLLAASQWKNAGRETPAAAMETIYWAALAGELEVLAEALLIPEEDRAKVDAWFAGLSETTRQQYGSPEQLIGLLVAKDAGPLTGMQVLAQNEISDTDVLLRVRFATDDGAVDSADYLLRRTENGWRLVVPADGVEWFARHLQPEK